MFRKKYRSYQGRAFAPTLSPLGFCALLGVVIQGPWLPSQGDKPAKARRAPAAVPAEKPGAKQASDPVREEFLKINYVFNRELYDLALPRYEKLLEENPGYEKVEDIHFAIALSSYNMAAKEAARGGGKPGEGFQASPKGGTVDVEDRARKETLKKAVSHLKEALKKKDFGARDEAMRILGQSLLLLEDYEGAAKTFQWILDRGPGEKDARDALLAALGLAESLYYQGKFEKAAEAYRKLLQGKPGEEDRERAEFYLAMSIYRAGEAGAAGSLEESIPLFKKAAGASSEKGPSPFSGDARYMLALALEARGDRSGAIEAFRALLGDAGENASGARAELAQFGLAGALFRAGKHKEAADQLQKFIGAYPASERRDPASLLLARSLLETGQPTQGAKMLQDLRASASAGDEACLWLARLYSRHGKHRSASSVLSGALKAFPESRIRRDLELDLVSSQLSDGDFEGAGALLARLEAGDAQPGARDQVAYLKAYALHRAKKFDESLGACEQFKASFPESRYLKDLSQLEAENKLLAGNYKGAVEAYGAYLEKFEKDLDGSEKLRGRFRAAQALHLGGKYGEALKALESLNPSELGPEAEKTLREDAVFAPYHYLIGDCAYQIKDHQRTGTEMRAFLKEVEARAAGLEAEAADARFKEAHSLQLSGDLEGAREAYKAALAKDPTSSHREQMSFELGQIAYSEKDSAGAARALERFLSDFPSSRFAPHALKLLGWMAYDAKDFGKAADSYRKLAEGFSDHALAAEAELQLALSLQASGQESEARLVLAQFKKKHPGDPRMGRVLFQEAVSLARDKKPKEALDALEKLRAGSVDPEMLPSILYEIAWCHRALSDIDAAMKTYGEIAAIQEPGPLVEAARLEPRELEFDRREYGRAKELLAPLVSGGGACKEKALYRLAWCHHMLEDHQGAVAAFDAIRLQFPESPLLAELGVLAAKAYLKNGDSVKAGEVFRGIVEGAPDGPQAEVALVSWGECLAEDRKFDEAKKRFEAFLERYPESAMGYRAIFGKAWADENLGRIDDAIKTYRKASRETGTPTGARAQFQIGQCLASRKQWKDAIVEFLQVPARYEHAEWTSKALLQVAGCFEGLEDEENAKKYYKEVESTFPDRDEAKLARERLQKLETN